MQTATVIRLVGLFALALCVVPPGAARADPPQRIDVPMVNVGGALAGGIGLAGDCCGGGDEAALNAAQQPIGLPGPLNPAGGLPAAAAPVGIGLGGQPGAAGPVAQQMIGAGLLANLGARNVAPLLNPGQPLNGGPLTNPRPGNAGLLPNIGALALPGEMGQQPQAHRRHHHGQHERDEHLAALLHRDREMLGREQHREREMLGREEHRDREKLGREGHREREKLGREQHREREKLGREEHRAREALGRNSGARGLRSNGPGGLSVPQGMRGMGSHSPLMRGMSFGHGSSSPRGTAGPHASAQIGARGARSTGRRH